LKGILAKDEVEGKVSLESFSQFLSATPRGISAIYLAIVVLINY